MSSELFDALWGDQRVCRALMVLGIPAATIAKLGHLSQDDLEQVTLGVRALDILRKVSLLLVARRWLRHLEQLAHRSAEIEARVRTAQPMIEDADCELRREISALSPEQQEVCVTWGASFGCFLDELFFHVEDVKELDKVSIPCPRVLH
jgi:hypothetical protein